LRQFLNSIKLGVDIRAHLLHHFFLPWTRIPSLFLNEVSNDFYDFSFIEKKKFLSHGISFVLSSNPPISRVPPLLVAWGHFVHCFGVCFGLLVVPTSIRLLFPLSATTFFF
jgi:hypothetical protein